MLVIIIFQRSKGTIMHAVYSDGQNYIFAGDLYTLQQFFDVIENAVRPNCWR